MERYIDHLNDKIIENIEHNMILKINLKDIQKLNENNKNQLEILESTKELTNEGTEEESKVNEEIEDIKKSIEDNEAEILKINENIEKNMSMKVFFKNQLMLLMATTHNFQTNENVNLNVCIIFLLNNFNVNYQNAYRVLESEKHDVDLNLIRCQKYLQQVVKDKQEQEKVIQSQKKEIDNLTNQLRERERRIVDKEKHLKKLKIKEENMNFRKNKVKKNNKKSNN